MSCGKRRFGSASDARRAHASAGFRLRAYRCPKCHGYHVANAEKLGAAFERRWRR